MLCFVVINLLLSEFPHHLVALFPKKSIVGENYVQNYSFVLVLYFYKCLDTRYQVFEHTTKTHSIYVPDVIDMPLIKHIGEQIYLPLS